LVQLRPILEDESRELLLDLPDEPLQLVRYTPPEPDPERPLLFEDELELQRGVTIRVVVRRAAQPIPLNPARAARRGGLVVLSGRTAHETTLAGLEARPGARHLYGEVRCEAIERQQRRHTVSGPPAPPRAASSLEGAMRFKQSPIRLHPGEQRGVSLLFDPTRVPPGTPIEVATDPGLSLFLWRGEVPEPVARG